MPKQHFHGGTEQPDEWQQDLQNHKPVENIKCAYDFKEIHRLHPGLSDAELKRIPVLPEGTELVQGAKYVDLLSPDMYEFQAGPGMRANDYNLYVAKTDVDYPLWNRIIGITNPERLDEANLPEQP